jgi:hypothetical protein
MATLIVFRQRLRMCGKAAHLGEGVCTCGALKEVERTKITITATKPTYNTKKEGGCCPRA